MPLQQHSSPTIGQSDWNVQLPRDTRQTPFVHGSLNVRCGGSGGWQSSDKVVVVAVGVVVVTVVAAPVVVVVAMTSGAQRSLGTLGSTLRLPN
jgi:hypothetical protein